MLFRKLWKDVAIVYLKKSCLQYWSVKIFIFYFIFNMRVLLVYYSYMLYDVSTASIANEYGFDFILCIRSFQLIVASVRFLMLFWIIAWNNISVDV